MATKVDRRSLLGEDDKEEVKEPEPAAAAEEAKTEEPPKVEKVKPLGMDYVRIVAEQWPKSAQGHSMSRRLPQGIFDMLNEQSEDFALGFANGIQAIHDICIKILLDELRGRLLMRNQQTVGNLSMEHLLTPQDRLVTTVAALTEGIGYLACKSLMDRTTEHQEKRDEEQDHGNSDQDSGTD